MKSLLVFLFLVISFYSVPAQDKSVATKIDLLLIHGDFKKAIDTCRQILSYDSLNPEIHYRIGVAYQNVLEEDLASSSFARAVELDPDNNNYNFMLARNYYGRGKFRLAEPLLRKLYPSDTLNWAYAYYLTSILMQSERFDDAAKIYRRFLQNDTGNYVYMDKLAFACLKKENYTEAIDLYNRSLAVNNKNTASIKNLAALYAATQRADTALALLTRGIEIDPSDMDLYLRRANLCFSKDWKKRALNDYLYLLASGDSNKIYFKRIGIGYCFNLEPEKAIDYLLEAYRQDSSDIETCNYLGQSYFKLGNLHESILYYNKGIKVLMPVTYQIRFNYMRCAEAQQMSRLYLDAIDSYIKSQNIAYDPSIDMTIANIYDEKLNNRREAIYYYQKFLDNIKGKGWKFSPEYMKSVKERLEFLKKDLAGKN